MELRPANLRRILPPKQTFPNETRAVLTPAPPLSSASTASTERNTGQCLPFVAENTRVTLRLPSGRESSISLTRCLERIQKKELEWIEEGVSVAYTTQPGWFDASGQLTDRCQWRPFDSGGATVMQLL